MFYRFWERWKALAHVIGDFQARLLLSAFYYIVLSPFALGVKIFSDPLTLKKRNLSHWNPKPANKTDFWEQARRQF